MLTNKTDNELKMEDGKNINAEQFLNGIIKSINKAPQGEYTATITRGLTCKGEIIANTYGDFYLQSIFKNQVLKE